MYFLKKGFKKGDLVKKAKEGYSFVYLKNSSQRNFARKIKKTIKH